LCCLSATAELLVEHVWDNNKRGWGDGATINSKSATADYGGHRHSSVTTKQITSNNNQQFIGTLAKCAPITGWERGIGR